MAWIHATGVRTHTALALATSLTACFDPALPNIRCSEAFTGCPDDLVCHLPEGECRPSGDTAIDAAPIDASVDAPPLGTLVERGLVVRYFMDQAPAGTPDAELVDSAPDPLDLSVEYDDIMTRATDDNGNRGLAWEKQDEAGAAATFPLNNTKVRQRLQGEQTATVEVAFELNNAGVGGRLVHIGNDGELGDLTLAVEGLEVVTLHWLSNNELGRWSVSLGGRSVLHAVLDAAADGERVTLYLDGEPLERVGGGDPGPNQTINVSTDASLVIGNSDRRNNSVDGFIGYAAVYSVALTPAEIANNATRLQITDDAGTN